MNKGLTKHNRTGADLQETLQKIKLIRKKRKLAK